MEAAVDSGNKFMDQVETNKDLKERRSKKEVWNPESKVSEQLERCLFNLKSKNVGEYVGRVK